MLDRTRNKVGTQEGRGSRGWEKRNTRGGEMGKVSDGV